MTTKVYIFGTSGMAREARDIADELGLETTFVAKDIVDAESNNSIGNVILESELSDISAVNAVIGIGEGELRRKIANRFSNKINFINLIHPSATFGRDQYKVIEDCKGVIICAGVRFTTNISVGNFSLFNLNATINHDSIIGDYVTVSPQATILGNVEIRSGAWIGAGAVINQGKNQTKRVIGSNTTIGSGTVVLNDCENDSVYVGTPARKIK